MKSFLLSAALAASLVLDGSQSSVPVYAQAVPKVEAKAAEDGGPSIKLPARIEGAAGAFIAVEADTNGSEVKWFAVTPGLNVFPAGYLKDSRNTVVTAARDGEYLLVGYTALGDKPSDLARTIVIVGTPAPPTPPVPPGPPTPPPVVDGKRALLIIHEAADTTPELSRLIIALRTGTNADYLKTKSHTLSILDDDSVDMNGQPTAIVQAWRAEFTGLTLPVLFVIDQAGNKLVHKQSLPPAAKADDVMAILKAHGG